jgi:hypothetical protein
MSDTAFEKAWRTSPWFGNAHEGTVAWSFWQAASLNQAVQAEAHLHEPQTAETCQHKSPHPIGCLVLKEPDGPVGSIHVFAEDEEFICLACEAEKQARDAARLAFETLAEERDHLKAERDTASGRGNNFRERYWLLEQTHEQDVRRLVAERDAQTSALRNSVEQAAIELIAVKVERDQHIEAAANKELDWFAEKRRADSLEAKCAVADEIVTYVKEGYVTDSRLRRAITTYKKDNPSQPLLERLAKAEAKCAEMDNALEHCERAIAWLKGHREPEGGQPDRALRLSRAARKDNLGGALLERLRRAEETCAAVYQWAGANEFPVELLDNLSIVAEGSEAEESPDCPYHKELPVAVDLKADLHDHVKALERVRKELDRIRLAGGTLWTKELCEALAACEPKERE